MKNSYLGAIVCVVSVMVSTQPSFAGCYAGLLRTPDVGSGSNQLWGISGTGISDVWAAGWYQYNGAQRTLIEHYDGFSWSVVPSPNDPDHPDDFLSSVSAYSASDAWVVGGMGHFALSQGRPFASHWDGSVWTEVRVPRAEVGNGISETLSSVSVNPINPNDVWAVGESSSPNSPTVAFAWHWNGRKWAIYRLQSPLYTVDTFGVSIAPNGEAWVVGRGFAPGRGWSIYHWNGSLWSTQDSVGTHENLFGISALAFDDVWAVGIRIEHFDGQTWQPSHRPTALDHLYSVSGRAPTDVWAAGVDESVGHYDGTNWSAIPQPPVGTRSAFAGIQSLPNGAITAGYMLAPHSNEYRTLSTLTTCGI